MSAVSAPTPQARVGWRERWLRRRDRLFADPSFQRRVAAFWPTRRIARAHASAAFDLCAGFVYSQVLLACVRLRLLDRLAGSPATARELAGADALPLPAMERLLEAATGLRLLEPRGDGRYGLGVLGAALSGNPGALAMIEHNALLYDDLRDPVAMMRGAPTALSRFWAYAPPARDAEVPLDDASSRDYTRLMSASQQLLATDVLDAYPMGRHRLLLDVGGGDGSFAAAAAERWPQLSVAVFDLPPVAAQAHQRFAAAGIAERAQAHGGDFIRDRLPQGADLLSLVRVLHDHDDALALALLRAAHEACSPGARILVAEPMADDGGRPSAMADAYFGIYLWAMGSGRARSPRRIAEMLEAAGFRDPRVLPTRRPLLTGAIVARRM